MAEYLDYYDGEDARLARAKRLRWYIDNVIGPVQGQRVLEVGCGDAGLIYFLAEAHSVVGIDVSGSGVRKARERGLDVRRRDMSIKPLPWPDDQSDLVISLELLENAYHDLR